MYPQKFLAAFTCFQLTESLGSVESLIDHSVSMTRSAMPKAEREKIGFSDGLFGIDLKKNYLDEDAKSLSIAVWKSLYGKTPTIGTPLRKKVGVAFTLTA